LPSLCRGKIMLAMQDTASHRHPARSRGGAK